MTAFLTRAAGHGINDRRGQEQLIDPAKLTLPSIAQFLEIGLIWTWLSRRV